jgi:hypothetical protein
MRIRKFYRSARHRDTAEFGVNRLTHAARSLRYNATHQAGHKAMLRSFTENSFSEGAPNSQTRGPDGIERARGQPAESQKLMEREMSSQTFTYTDEHRSRLARSALVAFFCHITDGLSALGRRFMNALYESRLRQANRIIRQHQHLIDRSND